MKKTLFFLLGLPLFIACSSTTIENLDAFKEKNLPAAEILPDKEELKGKKPAVVIFPFKNTDAISKKTNSGNLVYSKVLQVLKATNAEIVDRQSSEKFTDEIRLSQQNGAEYTGPEVADYAVDGKILQTAFYVVYNPPRSYRDSNGQLVTVEASCTYRGSVSGEFRLYRLPQNKILRSYSFKDTESRNIPATQKKSSFGNSVVSALFTGQMPSECLPNEGLTTQLITRAAEEAIRKNRIDIQNFFSPKGYITNMLEYDDTYLVKVNIGITNGLKQDQIIKIFTIKTSKNALTGEFSQEERQVAEGLVTNQIGPDYAYILIQSEDAEKLHLGDFVKVQFSKSGFEKFSDLDWL